MTPVPPPIFASWMMLAFVVVLLFIATRASRRLVRRQGRWDVKVCDRCFTSQPPHAGYCRQCGAKLG